MTASLIPAYGYCVFAAAVLYLAHSIRSLFDYRLHRDRTIFNYLFMTAACFLYSASLWGALRYQGLPVTIYWMYLQWFAALSMYFFYYRAIRSFIHDTSRVADMLIWTYGILLTAVAAVTVVYGLTGYSLFYEPFPSKNINSLVQAAGGALVTPTRWVGVIGAIVLVTQILGLFHFLRALMIRRSREYLLYMGIALSAISFFNDILASSGVFDSLSLIFISKGFEVIRFGRYYHLKAMSKIRELQAELREVSQRAAAAFVAGSITHDIRNPLTIILLNTELTRVYLQHVEGVFPKVRQGLDKIQQNAQRIHELIDNYLALLKNSSADDPELLPVLQLVRNALELSGPRLRAREVTRIETDVPADLQLRGSRVPLELVLANLLINSADALADCPERWIRVSGEQSNGLVRIRVLDAGSRIVPDVAAELFAGAFTTKTEGNGLGLKIARRIIESHGGRLFYDHGQPNTCFCIELPC